MSNVKVLKNSSYVEMVLELMMGFPTLFSSESKCQNNLFLTTSGIEVNPNDRTITECRRWVLGEGDTLIDRTAISILGGNRTEIDKKNWERFNYCKKQPDINHYDFPIFSRIGDDYLFHYENWRPKPKGNILGKDIFNSFLNETVDLPPDWLAALDDFCSHILRLSSEAYQTYRYAYYLQNGGAKEYWISRFKEDCETIPILWVAAEKIQNIIRPPKVKVPVIDYAKLTNDWLKKTERSIQNKLKKVKKS